MDSIERIIDEYGRKIYKYCYGMLRNRQEAEEAVQEVFIKAYKNMDKMHEIKSISSWLYKVAYNHCLNLIRKRKLLFFMPVIEDIKMEAAYYAPDIENNGLSEQLTSVMSKLSAEDRSVLIFRAIEEKSYEEIAVIFDKQPDAVRKQYERARKKVKGYLEIEKGGNSSEKVSVL